MYVQNTGMTPRVNFHGELMKKLSRGSIRTALSPLSTLKPSILFFAKVTTVKVVRGAERANRTERAKAAISPHLGQPGKQDGEGREERARQHDGEHAVGEEVRQRKRHHLYHRQHVFVLFVEHDERGEEGREARNQVA